MTPAARALDNDGRVAYIAGLSATVSSGEPPGVVVADASFIERLRRARHGQGTLPSVVMQRAWAYFIGLGHYAGALAHTAIALEGRMRALDRKSGGKGQSVSVRLNSGGGRIIEKK